MELVTRTRTEHLSDQDKSRSKGKPRCACLRPSHTPRRVTVFRAAAPATSWEASPFPWARVPRLQEAPWVDGGGGSLGAVAQGLLTGSYPFSSGGKTPFQSFLGMAQQHSSHSGVSQAQGAGGRRAGPGSHPPEH